MNSHCKTEWTEPEVQYVGLDVSKARLDYAMGQGRAESVPNTAAGIAALVGRLKQVPGVRVVCESTGGYERALLAGLAAAQVGACRVHPGRVRAFAWAEGLRAKTDRIDVQLLRRYAHSVHPRLEKPLAPEVAVLRDLLDYRTQLTELIATTTNRLETAGPALHALLDQQRAQLEAALAQAGQKVAAHLREHPALQAKADRLQQLQGVGPILAATLLGYLPELGEAEDNRLAALVGVAPHPNQSGTTKRPRHARGGRAEVRQVLYMAAVCAAHHNPVLAAFYQRLRAAGKPPKVCLVAVMRKMILVLNRMLKDPNFTLAN